MTVRLTAAVDTYLADLQRVRASGGATGERSSYGPFAEIYMVRYKHNFGVQLFPSYASLIRKAIQRSPERSMFPICEIYFLSTFGLLSPPRSECLDSSLMGAASGSLGWF